MEITMRLSAPFALAAVALLSSFGSAQALFGNPLDADIRSQTGQGATVQANPIPREIVRYDGGERPGTIIVSTAERRLYLVLQGGTAIRYGIGVGRPGFTWAGIRNVTRKAEWPAWTPPAQMLKRRPDLPRHMEGGEDNPLGARAMYLSGSLYRIHGSNEPDTIGQAVSSGCIRMTNEDVMDLYERVRVGTKVVVR
jgi:lipoprotein-anchoring transpeptidase ErfK/SrfK